jgi:hypothetical protein
MMTNFHVPNQLIPEQIDKIVKVQLIPRIAPNGDEIRTEWMETQVGKLVFFEYNQRHDTITFKLAGQYKHTVVDLRRTVVEVYAKRVITGGDNYTWVARDKTGKEVFRTNFESKLQEWVDGVILDGETFHILTERVVKYEPTEQEIKMKPRKSQ